MEGNGAASLSGLTTTAKAVYSAALAIRGPASDCCSRRHRQAEALSEPSTPSSPCWRRTTGTQLLPALDVLPLQNLSPHAEICEQRAIGLWSLATHRAPITIMPVASALLRIEPGQFYKQLALRLKVGEELPLEEVVAHLESIGYVRREPVEMVGEYSVRGGILDVFSPEAAKPVLASCSATSGIHPRLTWNRSAREGEDCVLLPLTEYQSRISGGTGEWVRRPAFRSRPLRWVKRLWMERIV